MSWTFPVSLSNYASLSSIFQKFKTCDDEIVDNESTQGLALNKRQKSTSMRTSSVIMRSISTFAWMKSKSVLRLTVPLIPIKQCSFVCWNIAFCSRNFTFPGLFLFVLIQQMSSHLRNPHFRRHYSEKIFEFVWDFCSRKNDFFQNSRQTQRKLPRMQEFQVRVKVLTIWNISKLLVPRNLKNNDSRSQLKPGWGSQTFFDFDSFCKVRCLMFEILCHLTTGGETYTKLNLYLPSVITEGPFLTPTLSTFPGGRKSECPDENPRLSA